MPALSLGRFLSLCSASLWYDGKEPPPIRILKSTLRQSFVLERAHPQAKISSRANLFTATGHVFQFHNLGPTTVSASFSETYCGNIVRLPPPVPQRPRLTLHIGK